jgi:hypothetical protein
VDESATGSVNFFLTGSAARQSCAGSRIAVVHLRPPSVDRGVQSFLWALLFFLVLYFGMVAVDVSKGTAIVLSLVASFLIFLLVRTRGRSGPAA